MADKHDYMQQFTIESNHEIAKTVAMFGGFTEGCNVCKFCNAFKFSETQQMRWDNVTWSVRDESLHCEGMIKLFMNLLKKLNV